MSTKSRETGLHRLPRLTVLPALCLLAFGCAAEPATSDTPFALGGSARWQPPSDPSQPLQRNRTLEPEPFSRLGLQDTSARQHHADPVGPFGVLAILALGLWLVLANRRLTSERSRALALRKSLAQEHTHLETLVQTLPDLVCLKDPNGVYLTCNARCEAFFGAPRAAIVGRTDYDFVAHQEADLFHAFDLRAMETGTASVNTATPAAIGSWPRSHRNCGRNCVRATPRHASAATSLRS